MTDDTSLPTPLDRGRVSTLEQLADIPEEEIWLQKQKSARTRRAYRLDVQHFMRSLGITAPEELRQADHKAVIAWERYMRETKHAASSTIRRRLAALSSLYKHRSATITPRAIRSGRSSGRRSTVTKDRPGTSRRLGGEKTMESLADGIGNLIGFQLVLGFMFGIYLAPSIVAVVRGHHSVAVDRLFELCHRLDHRRLNCRPDVVGDSNTSASSDHADRQHCT
jgi:hypothetical protein